MLRSLQTLDISENGVADLSALSGLPLLSTLIAPGNRLSDVRQLQPLATLPSLQTLDLSKARPPVRPPAPFPPAPHPRRQPRPRRRPPQNKLSSDDVVPFLASLPLSYLKLEGNPCVISLPHYRKAVVHAIGTLNYLDDAPVRPRERRLAAAFVAGGFDAERAEREAIKAR